MTDEKLHEQLERYSNAIVGFVVLQSVAFCFSVGTNQLFHCLVISVPGLATGLSVHFMVVTLLALLATWLITRQAIRRSGSQRRVVKAVFAGKALAIVVFTALPVGTLLFYVPSVSVPGQKCMKV